MQRGVITVRPSGINGFTYFEQDMLDHSEQIHGNEEEEIKKTVSELRYNVWGSNKVHNALSSIINYLSSNGKYLKNIERQKEVKSEPIVSFAPAIILRKRGHRNFIDFIDKSQINLREKNNIPSLVKKLISSQSKIYEENNNTNEKIVDKTQNIYFPLPANDQQREILDVLNKKDGILVEGPPGTGKSHTIANLTTHLLAIGKRVLITSNGVRALKVLKDKFPKEIQSLCINVLGDDTKANQTLEESVEDINNRNTEWKEENELKQIDEYYNNLNSQNKKEGSIIKDIIAVREQETHKYDNKFKYYSGTLSNIAKQIAEETDKYNWITQDEYIEDQCPINEVQLNELHQLINTYSDEKRKDLKKFIFSPNNLWSVEEFKAHLEKRNKNYEDKNENKNKIKVNFNLDFLKNLNDAELFLNDIKSIKNILDTIHTDSSSWIANVLNDIFMKKDNIWKKLLDNSNKDLLKTKTLFKEIEDKNISGLDNNDLLKIQSDIETLLVHLKSGKGFGFQYFVIKLLRILNIYGKMSK